MNRVQKHNIRYYETSPTAISSTEWLFWCLPDNPLDSGRCDGVTVISQLSLEWHTHTQRERHRLFHQSFSQTQTKSNGFCVCVLEKIQFGNTLWAKQMLWNGRWDYFKAGKMSIFFILNHSILLAKYIYSDKNRNGRELHLSFCDFVLHLLFKPRSIWYIKLVW